MYQSKVVLSVVLVSLCSFATCTDYCKICSNHIGCGNTGTFATKCPADRSMVDISIHKEAILKSHNTKRNTIASGNLSGFKPAVRMATMQWNDELAKLASYNVMRCVYGHDGCRNTDQFKYSGQNIAKNWWSNGYPPDSTTIANQIDSWWSEYVNATMADIDKYPANPRFTIGHFTVMAADKNVAVGCASIKYRDPSVYNWFSQYLVCNYASTNIIDRAIYVSGASGSKCTSGRNPSFPALCSASESIDVNRI